MKKNIGARIRVIAIIAFGGTQENYKLPKFVENSVAESLYSRLIQMIDRGEINEAENLLLDKIEGGDFTDMQIALYFYSYLNEKSDEFLGLHNYKREEIEVGISNLIFTLGYDKIL